MESDDNVYQLVLTVFKGLNFVVKTPGVKIKLVSKLRDSILESKVYYMDINTSDPDFHHQVGWKLTKKQFQELRVDRDVVKIECHELSEDSDIDTLMGYCTISVKDAVEIDSYAEIDPKNAFTQSLKGTKPPWITYRPMLQLLLHCETGVKPAAPASTRKMVLSRDPLRTPFVDPFKWTVNNELGYFQLGEPDRTDDLYIMNIVLTCVRYLDQLLFRHSPSEDIMWRVQFEAFGMTIMSDSFFLEGNDEIKHTYLGDKSTARIRANREEFMRYIKETALDMKIQTLSGYKWETQGTVWVELEPLANHDSFGIRSGVEILPQHGKFITRHTRPHLAYDINIKRSPEFFKKNFMAVEDINYEEDYLKSSRDDLLALEMKPTSGTINEGFDPNCEEGKKEENPEALVGASVGDKTEVERKVYFGPNSVPPGNYSLTLKFTGFAIRSHAELTGNWVISFCHPLMWVSDEDDSCRLIAKTHGHWTGKMTKFHFDEDEFERWELHVTKLSPEIIESPLKVHFFKGDHRLPSEDEESIAFAHIHLGDIFTVEPGPEGRKLEGAVAIYKFRPHSHHPMKVGYLGYDFTLQEIDESSANTEVVTSSVVLETLGTLLTNRLSKSRDRHLDASKAEAERLFKTKLQEKERAYFQILSREQKALKENNDKIVNLRMSELADKLKEIAEKEKILKVRESELSEATSGNEYELTKERDDLKLMIQRLEADKKLEVDSLSKRLEDVLNDWEVTNSKILKLQMKLEEKDGEVSDLRAERNKCPQRQAIRDIDVLEHKIQQIHQDLDKALSEKEQYRVQSEKMAKAL